MAGQISPYKFVHTDPKTTGAGKKYRRRKPLLPSTTEPNTRKRSRSTSDYESQCKRAEVLDSRVSELEVRIPPPSLPTKLATLDQRVSWLEVHSTTDPPDHKQGVNKEHLQSLDSRISRLEHHKRIQNDYSSKVDRKAGLYLCPDNRCGKKYVESSDLGKHCQQKHGSMGSIVSQRVCYRCPESFDTTRELIIHEKTEHGEVYDLRIEAFLSLFHQSSTADKPPLLSPPLSESQSPSNNQLDHTSILEHGNQLAGQPHYNEVRSSCHPSQVDNLKGPPADARLLEMNQHIRDGVHGTMKAFLQGIGKVKVHFTMSPIAEPHNAVEQANDLDLYNASGELDVNEFLSAFQSGNCQTYSDHSEISEGHDTGLNQASKHQDIGSFLSGPASTSEVSNTKSASDRIDDIALYNAAGDFDVEEFHWDMSDLWSPNMLPPFNTIQSRK